MTVAESRFTFDPRSLGLGRIAVGLLLLVDLALRVSSLDAHYADSGALPRDSFTLSHFDFAWSLHLLSGSAGFEAALFALTFAAALAFTLGFHTRIVNAACALLYLSLCGRNPLLRDGQDDLFRLLLFFFLFLPMGAAFSLDARRGGQPVGPVKSLGTVAFTAQILVLYGASVLHKLQSPWWTSLGALERVLHLRRYQTPLAQWLIGFPRALEVGTAAAMILELSGPIAIVVFWSRPKLRTALIVAMCGLHLGMWANLRLGVFPPLCIATWLMFLPAWAWRSTAEGAAPVLPKWAGRAALGFVALALALNAQNLAHAKFPEALNFAGRAVGLQQWWGVFAPTADEASSVSDGWFWVQGRGANGQLRTVEVPYFTSSDEPPSLLRFSTSRWRHLLANLTVVAWPPGSAQRRTQQRSREALARWLCRDFNEHHPDEKLDQLYLFFYRHHLGQPVPTTRELLGSGDDACTTP